MEARNVVVRFGAVLCRPKQGTGRDTCSCSMRRLLTLVVISMSLYSLPCLEAFTAHTSRTPRPIQATWPRSISKSSESMALHGIRSELRRILLPNRWFSRRKTSTTTIELVDPSDDYNVKGSSRHSTITADQTALQDLHSFGPSMTTKTTTLPVATTSKMMRSNEVVAANTAASRTATAVASSFRGSSLLDAERVDWDDRCTNDDDDTAAPQLHLNVLSASTSATLLRAKTAASTSHLSLYSLPSSARNLTQLEREFRDMIEYFANYSEADLLSIADPRKRALFEGVAASSYCLPVYRAFEVLFEDLLPLRLAGRLIFTKLKQFMAASLEQRKTEIDLVVDRTGLVDDTKQIEEIRLMFVSTASNLNGDSWLTLQQLAETGIITATATEVLGFDSAEKLLHGLDTTQSGRLTFLDLMSGLWESANELCGLENCNPQVVLHNLLVELNEHPPPPADFNARLDAKRRQYAQRYDEMVASFIQWKDLVPPPPPHGTTENRRMEVMRGCFVGAENPKVVNALRIVYVDYAGLRVAGDIIFKLVSTLLNRRR